MWYQLGRPFLLKEPIYVSNNIKILKKKIKNIALKSQHMSHVSRLCQVKMLLLKV